MQAFLLAMQMAEDPSEARVYSQATSNPVRSAAASFTS